MGRHIFHGQVQAQAASQSTDLVIKSQVDTAEANAKARANHTGTQTMSTISDAQSFVDGRIALVIDSAPGALDTLNELAAALGDDPNFAATTATALGALDARLDTLEASSGTAVYKSTIGDAIASTFTVTHSLNSTDVTVDVIQLSNGQDVFPVITRPSVNTVGLDFGSTVPASASHRVIVEKK